MLFFFFPNVGVLLPELVVSIVLLLSKNAGLMQEAGAVPLLGGLLEHLDRFNHLAPGKERDDHEELAWPGVMGAHLRGMGLTEQSLVLASFVFAFSFERTVDKGRPINSHFH